MTARSETEIASAWEALDRLYTEMPTNPVVIGAHAAAEWTTGRSDISPITRVQELPTGDRLQWEGHEADRVELGLQPGDPRYARGVSRWMFWWIGREPLPAWIRALQR